MEHDLIGHTQDWKHLEQLIESIEFAILDIKDAINQRNYHGGEETAIKIVTTAQKLHKQLGIMPMRVEIPRPLEEANPEEAERITALNDILFSATCEINELKKSVQEALQPIGNDHTEFRGTETHMACLIGENDFAYRGDESFIHYDIVFPIEGKEPLNPEETWDNGLNDLQACELLSDLCNSRPPLWLDDIMRIDTILLDMNFQVRKSVKVKF